MKCTHLGYLQEAAAARHVRDEIRSRVEVRLADLLTKR